MNYFDKILKLSQSLNLIKLAKEADSVFDLIKLALLSSKEIWTLVKEHPDQVLKNPEIVEKYVDTNNGENFIYYAIESLHSKKTIDNFVNEEFQKLPGSIINNGYVINLLLTFTHESSSMFKKLLEILYLDDSQTQMTQKTKLEVFRTLLGQFKHNRNIVPAKFFTDLVQAKPQYKEIAIEYLTSQFQMDKNNYDYEQGQNINRYDPKFAFHDFKTIPPEILSLGGIEILNNIGAKNLDFISAPPVFILNLLLPHLDNLSEEFVSLFEKNIKEISKVGVNYGLFKKIIKRYPEYFLALPKSIRSSVFDQMEFPDNAIAVTKETVFSSEELIGFFDSLSSEDKVEASTYVINRLASNSPEKWLPLYYKNSSLYDTMYAIALEAEPSLYFTLHLYKYFKKDKRTGEGPMEVEEEDIVERLVSKEPVIYFQRGLNLKYPKLEKTAAYNLVYNEDRGNEENEPYATRKVRQLIYFLDSSVAAKYPELRNAAMYKISTNDELSIEMLNYRNYSKASPEIKEAVVGKIIDRFIDEERYKDFFKYKLHVDYPVAAQTMIKNLLNENKLRTILSLKLPDIYPGLLNQVGDRLLDNIENNVDKRSSFILFRKHILYNTSLKFNDLKSLRERFLKILGFNQEEISSYTPELVDPRLESPKGLEAPEPLDPSQLRELGRYEDVVEEPEEVKKEEEPEDY